MATTDVSICNTALIMVGANDINSFTENTVEAKLASNVYERTKFTLLQYHPWRFSLKQVDLGGALTASPLFKWTYKYKLPADTLRVINIKDNFDYETFEQRELYTDVNPCQIVYQKKVAEQDMPAYFVRALEFHLARLFAISLQEDAGKMDIFERSADKETARARSIDAQQQPNIGIPDVNYSTILVRQ